jgi:hypothetical protein
MDRVSQCYAERYRYVAGGHATDVAERVLLLGWGVVLHDTETNVDNNLGVSEYSRVGFLFGFGRNMC